MPVLNVDFLIAWGIGTPELLIFAGILLLLFGSTKLPSLMRNMGRSVNEFKAGIKEKPQEVDHLSADQSSGSGSRTEEELSEV